MRSAFDFSPYRRSTIGFDRLFDMLENNNVGNGDNYPPFDLVKLGEDEYRIDLAVAGFHREDIDITAEQNRLIVKGQRGEDEDQDYLHRGIATRSFERKFELADHVRVTDADLHDGLLSISLAREIPEAMKPRKISIGGAADKQIENKERQTEDA